MLDQLLEGIKSTSILEWSAVATSIIYVILAARKNILCWIFAFISSTIYVYICWDALLYLESGLQLFYVVMAIVGFYLWRRVAGEGEEKDIQQWSLLKNLTNIVLSGLAAGIMGWVFDNYTDQAYPYIDAFTTCYSLAATFMVTRKVLENWIYWIVIDTVSIYLYFTRELYLTSVLFIIFTVLAVFGYFAWNNQYKKQKA